MNKLMRNFLVLATIYLSVCLVIFPKAGAETAYDALSLCLRTVVPALFPYLVCSGYLSASGTASVFSRWLSPVMQPIFRVPGSGAIALVLGMLSGYPIGAVCAVDLYQSGECGKADAEKLIAFCNNSGPVFIMSVVGAGIFGSQHIGRLLYISHVLSAILVGIIIRTYSPRSDCLQKALPKLLQSNTKNTLRIFGGVMDSSVFSILKICGFVIFFSVLVKSLPKSPISPYIHALLEITGGVQALAASDIGLELKLSLISFFVALSGLSVFFQVGAIASKCNLSLKPYVFGKLLQGMFSAVLTKIMVSKLPETVNVFSQSDISVDTAAAVDCLGISLFMLGFGLLVLAVLLGFARLRR